MKPSIFWIVALLLLSCKNDNKKIDKNPTTVSTVDTVKSTPIPIPDNDLPMEYSNERFRKVTVEKIGEDSYRIKGEAQIFEANFSWVVEDGHNELKKGYEMTDAGAPEWGAFNFTIEVQKKKENSTLHLILFEASAKDGSRQYELPIPLP